jgi:hypothetical protein
MSAYIQVIMPLIVCETMVQTLSIGAQIMPLPEPCYLPFPPSKVCKTWINVKVISYDSILLHFYESASLDNVATLGSLFLFKTSLVWYKIICSSK